MKKYYITSTLPKPFNEHEIIIRNALTHFRLTHKAFHSFTVPRIEGVSPLMLCDLDHSLKMSRDLSALHQEEEEAEEEAEALDPKPKRRKTIADSAVDAVEDTSRLCFRVLSTRVGRMKHIGNFVRSSGAPKLSEHDVAITLHEEFAGPEQQHGEEPLVAGLKSKRAEGFGVQILYGFDGFSSVDDLEKGCFGWSDLDAAVRYGFANCDHTMNEDVHAAVAALYRSHALPATDIVHTGGDPKLQPWSSTLQRGFVTYLRLASLFVCLFFVG